MANTITKTTIQDGKRNTIIKVDIIGDGSGDESNYLIFDASAYYNPTVNKKLNRVKYTLDGFSARLIWDATIDAPLLTLEKDKYSDFCFDGGLSNTYFPGRTGDILLTTIGLGAGESGTIILHIQSKR
jgi:hypothetical protein